MSEPKFTGMPLHFDSDSPQRDTPTQFARKLALAVAQRPAQKASEEVELSRNAKGDWQFSIKGVTGDAETLTACASRVFAIAQTMAQEFPLSRTQIYGRDYTPNERDPQAGK